MLLLASLALACAVASAPAQAGTYVLKFNHVLGAKEPYHQGFLNWAKAVEEKTKGGLKIEVFHSAQLGVEEDIIEQIRQEPTSARIPTRPAWGTTSPASPS
jgi:TRAP-type C4-dicarboxylate transport system substrate-binding protein